jgi:hypothetical protein
MSLTRSFVVPRPIRAHPALRASRLHGGTVRLDEPTAGVTRFTVDLPRA